MNSNRWLFGIHIFTASGIILYWTTVFTGLFPVNEIIPGYLNWFLAFPLADFWIATSSICALFFLRKQIEKAYIFGLISGSSLVFLGLYALLYGINTGLIFMPTIDELIEILIKLYCLTVGSLLMISSGKQLLKAIGVTQHG